MDDDWQSNLQNWKKGRKLQSSYQRVQDLEIEEETPRKAKSKTYKEIIEERQRRKSSHEIHVHNDPANGNFEYESSKVRAASSDDLSKPDDIKTEEHNSFSGLCLTPKSCTETKNFTSVDEPKSFVKQMEEIKKDVAPSTYTVSDNNSQRFSSSCLHAEPVHTKDSKFDKNALRDGKHSADFSANREKFETGNTKSLTVKSLNEVNHRIAGGTNVSDKLKMWNKPAVESPITKTVEQKKLSQINNEKGNVFFEKIIRINQRPNHEKGFGFTVVGGHEFNAPIVVDKVVRGGSADICELKAGDEILAINGTVVEQHCNKSIQNVLEQAVATGTVELKIKRLKDLEDDFEEENFSDDDIKPVVNKRVPQFSESVSSQWSSPPSTPPAMPSVADDEIPSPPSLPSVPPPPPNWNTFPEEMAVHADDASKGDAAFIVTDDPFTFKTGNQKGASEDHLQKISDASKEDILRRKSQFLGLKLEESQEFKALQDEKEKKLKHEQTNSFDFTSSFSVSHLSDTSLPVTVPSLSDDHLLDKKVPSNKSYSGYLVDEKENEKLQAKEEQLRRKEEMMHKEEQQLQQEKERLKHETEEHLSIEREKLQREKEQQQERERLLREKEEHLRQEQEREKLRREKEEDIRQQNEKHLKLEIERLEREKEQQLISVKEQLEREKEEEINREKERLKKESEHQEKEQAERLHLEQERRKAEQEMLSRNFSDKLPLSGVLTSGQESLARKPSIEPSDSEIAEYSMRYGGKTFARLTAQFRSESLGEFTVQKCAPKADAHNFIKSESNSEKSVGRKFETSDNNAGFSSIGSNFKLDSSSNAVALSKETKLESWNNNSDLLHPGGPEQFQGVVHPNDQHRSSASLTLGVKSKDLPQVSLQTTSLASSFGHIDAITSPPMESQSAVLQAKITELPLSKKLRPQIEGQTTMFEQPVNPEITERTTSLQPHSGEQTERSNVIPHDGHSQKPLAQLMPTRPQNEEQVTIDEHLLLKEKFSNKAQRDHSTDVGTGNQSTHSNVSYLLYGDADETAARSTDGIGSGGYNSHAFNHSLPSGPGLPFLSVGYPKTNGHQENSYPQQPGNFQPNIPHPRHQFNESWPSAKTSVLPYSRNTDSNEVNQYKAGTLGPRPFEPAWKQSSDIGDHCLAEEAEDRRNTEQCTWPMNQETNQHHSVGPLFNQPYGYSSNSHYTLPNQGYSDHSTVHSEALHGSVPLNLLTHKSVSELHPQRSSCSVPEPVKQTLLNRINTRSSGGASLPLSPLPSYPLNLSHMPLHTLQSASIPVSDSNQFPGSGRSFPGASHSTVSSSNPSSHGGAIDSLFAYHLSDLSGTNFMSQQSVSRSHGSLHLDGCSQNTDVWKQRNQGPYPASSHMGDDEQISNSYTVFVRDPGRVADSFPQHCQPVVQNLLCSVCQCPLKEVGGMVSMKDGDLRLRCQNCFHENEVKYSKI